MDFDEIEYLEKTVENSEAKKDTGNGGDDDAAKSERKDRKSSRHRSDENDDDLDIRSKRARSGDETRDHDRRREKSWSRHRSSPDHSSRDGDRSERDRHRSNREHRDRHREYRNGKEREGSRDRDKDKVKERHRESEREKEHDRSRRSRSTSERRRSDHPEKEAERERDREKSREREREREKSRERERESRRYKEKKEEPERDQRTVFAYQICLKADERDVYDFFSRAGKVRDVRLIMDRNSRRSKGVGYIEFYDAMSVPMAIALSGQPLLGHPVMVKPSEAEKNLVQSNVAVVGPGGSVGPYSGGARRLYVGNLHFNITEEQLRQVFEPFGAVELVQLPLDPETGQCKGFGFVQFARLEDARAAQSLNGQLDIAGRIIKVSAVPDQVGMQDIGVNAGDFDDDDGGGLALNARSRAILMQKLDRSGTTSSLVTPAVNGSSLALPAVLGFAPVFNPLVAALGQASIPALPGLPGSALPVTSVPVPLDTVGVPSECLILKNMFDPTSETDDDFDLDIKDDVQDEVSKFGTVKHIFVDKNSAGHVYLRFETTTSAMSAQRALHGRWFAGKMIIAAYMLPLNYEAKFPESK